MTKQKLMAELAKIARKCADAKTEVYFIKNSIYVRLPNGMMWTISVNVSRRSNDYWDGFLNGIKGEKL